MVSPEYLPAWTCPSCGAVAHSELEAEIARLELLLAVARQDAEHFGDVALEHEGMRREAEGKLWSLQETFRQAVIDADDLGEPWVRVSRALVEKLAVPQ